MRRILLSAALIVVAFLVGRAVYIAAASDVTRIGWLFAAEAEAFNSASPLSALSHFAPDYHDDTTDVSLQTLRGAVLWTFQNRRDAQRHFLYRVELPELAGKVTVDGDDATAEPLVRLYEGHGADERLAWELRLIAHLRRVDGEWRIERSTHTTTRGNRPGH